jgi:hypothetical protein
MTIGFCDDAPRRVPALLPQLAALCAQWMQRAARVTAALRRMASHNAWAGPVVWRWAWSHPG